MNLIVAPIHHHPQHTQACCELINSEWHRSETARLHSLNNSCDTLPTSLVLLQNNKVLGHAKLSKLPLMPEACFVESVVIDKNERGKGYGKVLMLKSEEFCKDFLKLRTVYLSTKGQEGFYQKLGYNECQPVSIYGSYIPKKDYCEKESKYKGKSEKVSETNLVKFCENISLENDTEIVAPPLPPPPPLLLSKDKLKNVVTKTFMKKELK